MKYRMLRKGEIIRKGDEFNSVFDGWAKCINTIGEKVDGSGVYEQRRRAIPIIKTRPKKHLTRASISTSGRWQAVPFVFNEVHFKINLTVLNGKVVGVSLAN
jgi:hypothetical protein